MGEHFVDGVKAVHALIVNWHATYGTAKRLEPAVDPLKKRLQAELEEFIDELDTDPTVIAVQAFAG
jgi:hypothetical protein